MKHTWAAFAAAALTTAGLAVVAAPQAQAAGCTTSWAHAASGAWTDAGNWDNGVPTSASAACIDVAGTYTVTVTESDGAGTLQLGGSSGTQTLLIRAGQYSAQAGHTSTDAAVTMGTTDGSSVIGPHGVVELAGTANPASPADPNGNAQFISNGVVDNQGLIQTDPAAAGDHDGRGLHNVRDDWTNEGTIAFDGPSYEVGNHAIVNNGGTIRTGATGSLGLVDNNTAITNSSGTIVNDGAIVVPGACTFTQGAGTTSGNPIEINGILHLTGSGAASFDASGAQIHGDLAASQRVLVDGGTTFGGGSGTQDTLVNWFTPATIHGHVTLTSTGTNTAAVLNGNPSASNLTIATDGTVTAAAGHGGQRRIIGDVVNHGTVDVQSNLVHDTDGAFANNGTVHTATGATLELHNPFTNGTGGKVTNSGTVDVFTTWHQQAGITSGHAVQLMSGNRLSFEGSGSASFAAANGVDVVGNVGTHQSLTLNAAPSDLVANFEQPFTNAGTIALVGNASGQVLLSVAGSGILTNTGTISASGTRSAQLAVQTGSIVNNGTISVGDGAGFGAGQGLTQGAKGTTHLTVHGAKLSHVYADSAKLAGTLSVATVAAAPAGHALTALTANSVKGTYSSVSAPNASYHATYSATAVTLTPRVRTALATSVSTPTVTYGHTSTVRGTLTQARHAMAGRSVALYSRTAGSTTYHRVTAATTNSKGSVAFTVKPARTTAYQLRYAGSTTYTAATGTARTVSVRPTVSAAFSKSAVTRGKAVTLSGRLAPAIAKVQVALQRWTGKSWAHVSTATTSSAGRYAFTVHAPRGTTKYRVALPAATTYLSALSPTRVLTGR